MVAVRNSPKPVHLNAFLIRAKALYQPTSVVDKPMEQVGRGYIWYNRRI
jgi:hypothetical protein